MLKKRLSSRFSCRNKKVKKKNLELIFKLKRYLYKKHGSYIRYSNMTIFQDWLMCIYRKCPFGIFNTSENSLK